MFALEGILTRFLKRRGWLPVLLAGWLAVGGVAGLARGEALRVGVAANFRPVAEALGPLFEAEAGGAHRLRVSSAATGVLFSQILHGAPFDVLLAADSLRPRLLEERGLAVPGSMVVFAYGRLALVYREGLAERARGGCAAASPPPSPPPPPPPPLNPPFAQAVDCGDYLANGLVENADVRDWLAAVLGVPGLRLAIAHPEHAPFGVAAMAVLEHYPLAADAKLLRGANVGQAYQMWHAGGADAALVSASFRPPRAVAIPPALHPPIEQTAVILQRAAAPAAAQEFIDFLGSPAAQAIIRAQGYALEHPDE